MGRVIADSAQGEYYPLVGIRTVGNYVKGKVVSLGQTANGNPVVTLTLIDLEGSTSQSVSKGVYNEVDVNIGDKVQIVGSVKQLREKLPQLAVGDIATITFLEKKKINGGKTMNFFKVEVED